MQRSVFDIDEKRGLAEMRALVVSDDIDAMNAEERRNIGKGFTLGRTMRKIANIDIEEFNALLANMDKDALDFEASGYTNKKAFRRLIARNPQWRCSEGGI